LENLEKSLLSYKAIAITIDCCYRPQLFAALLLTTLQWGRATHSGTQSDIEWTKNEAPKLGTMELGILLSGGILTVSRPEM